MQGGLCTHHLGAKWQRGHAPAALCWTPAPLHMGLVLFLHVLSAQDASVAYLSLLGQLARIGAPVVNKNEACLVLGT